MAIGRISGPMLLRNLERQGLDLSIDGDIIYFDVTRRRVGINTAAPRQALDVQGNVIINGKVSVDGLYSLPTYVPDNGSILVATGGPNSETFWGPAPPASGIRRRKFEYTFASLPGYGNVQAAFSLGVSSVVYNLTVTRPAGVGIGTVKVEAFTSPARDDENPYTFIATDDHQTDDGTVYLNDGSSFQSRQYSIWANFEEPPTQNIYVTVSRLDNYYPGDSVKLELFYYPAVTDNGIALEVLAALPAANNYVGKMVFRTTDNTVHVYGPSGWVALN